MRIKEIEARLAAIKQEIEQRGDAMTAAEIEALEHETTQLTEERAGLIAAAHRLPAWLPDSPDTRRGR